jgi:hypothetical protein
MLFTRAITLAIISLRVLLFLIAKFDLKIIQLDAVNVFVHVELDETIYMKMSSEYEKQEKMLLLKKTLYELKRSSIL